MIMIAKLFPWQSLIAGEKTETDVVTITATPLPRANWYP